MKTVIGAAMAALALTAAFPAAAHHNASHSLGVQVAQAQPLKRPAQPAAPRPEPGRPAGAMPGMMSEGAMPGQGMMSGMGMPMDMNQMMSSCPCCREAMQGKPAKAS